MLLWAIVFLLIVAMLWAARPVLLPFIIGLVLAYLLLPLVNWLERRMPARLRDRGGSRILSIILTYLLFLLLIAGLMAFVVPKFSEQVGSFLRSLPALSSQLQDLVDDALRWYRESIPSDWKQSIEAGLADVAQSVLTQLKDSLIAVLSAVFGSVSFVIGLVIIPFWLFYILQDESQVKVGVIRALHPDLRPDVQCLAALIDDVLSAYIRGQLILCLFVGALATVALLIIGVPSAAVLGLIAGIFEILPNIGPFLGAIPAILVALATNPISALWVALAFFAIQMIENLVLVPRISGQSVRLHPALVMVVLVIGGQLAGFVGMLIAVPVTAMIRDVFLYLYLRLLDEPLSPAEAMARIRSDEQVLMEA
jgi:predicted PurR-regulated permease PerM